jgi:hypothetical protein
LIEAALEQEMMIQLYLNQNMQVCFARILFRIVVFRKDFLWACIPFLCSCFFQNALVNPKIVAPVKVVIGEKQTPWRAHAGTDAANSSHVGVPTSVGPAKVGQLHIGKTPGDESIETPRTVTTSNKAHSQRPTPAISTSSGIATPQSLLSSVLLRSPVKSKGDEVIEQTHGQSTDQTTVPSFAMITTSGSQLIMKYLEQSGWLHSTGDDALLMWVLCLFEEKKKRQDVSRTCPGVTDLCDPSCNNVFTHIQRWSARTPEFQMTIVLVSSPLTLLVALWGMTSKQTLQFMKSKEQDVPLMQRVLSWGR